jgi:hypothetical protein
MADCITANLEAAPAPAAAAAAGTAPGDEAPATQPAPARSERPVQTARPVNALSLIFAVLWGRIKRLFGRG